MCWLPRIADNVELTCWFAVGLGWVGCLCQAGALFFNKNCAELMVQEDDSINVAIACFYAYVLLRCFGSNGRWQFHPIVVDVCDPPSFSHLSFDLPV